MVTLHSEPPVEQGFVFAPGSSVERELVRVTSRSSGRRALRARRRRPPPLASESIRRAQLHVDEVTKAVRERVRRHAERALERHQVLRGLSKRAARHDLSAAQPAGDEPAVAA